MLKCLEIKQSISKQSITKRKVTVEIRKYLELNGSENMAYQNLLGPVKIIKKIEIEKVFTVKCTCEKR